MAFKTSNYGDYGSGALGTVLNPSGQINTYANVTAISTNTVTIGTASAGIYETFAVGKEIMLHVSALVSGSDTTYLGCYMVATITAVNGSTLTLSKDVSGLVASGSFANYQVQALTVAQFDTLNLTGTITPPAYSATNKYGGILAFKCKTAFNYSGSAAINLVAKGIPIANVAYRPATAQETNENQMGWENHIASRNLYMNCPDGVVFIMAKTSAGSGTAARIGGTTAGVAKYPYNTTFANASSSVVKGGPTILWVSDTITGFDPSIISKTSSNTSGRGLGRAYIATNSKIQADELLYAVDCVSNVARLISMGIKSFGTGALGTALSLSGQVNSYAPVSAISADGKTLTIGTKYEGAYEKFAAGSVVMFHVSRQTGSDNTLLGKFILATVLSASGSAIVLDTAVTNVISSNVLSNYKCQLITVAQFDTLANSASYTGAKAYDDTAGCGGILAMAAKTTMDLSGGTLDMTGKGIPNTVSRPAVSWQCSGLQNDCLPLSQGNGAVLLIANKLKMNSSTKIGASYAGASYGGAGGAGGGVYGTAGGAASGAGATGTGAGGAGGSGYGIGGTGGTSATGIGAGAGAGSSIYIIANNIDGFSISSITTGGAGGAGGIAICNGGAGGAGGAGYGGGAGGSGSGGTYGGGGDGGGGAGTCFIYANTITNPDYTAVVAS